MQGCTFVNQYVVVKTLGQGAYGKVKLCLNSEDHNLYALKLVSKVSSLRALGPYSVLSCDVCHPAGLLQTPPHHEWGMGIALISPDQSHATLFVLSS